MTKPHDQPQAVTRRHINALDALLIIIFSFCFSGACAYGLGELAAKNGLMDMWIGRLCGAALGASISLALFYDVKRDR